jgi:Ubiquitin elongating factor core
MSGFIPDLASWALRGSNSEGNGDVNQSNSDPSPELTEQEIRARRLAKLATGNTTTSSPMQIDQSDVKSPTLSDSMQVDEDRKPAAKVLSGNKTSSSVTKESPSISTHKKSLSSSEDSTNRTLKKAKNPICPPDLYRKVQRRKDMLLRKVLHIILAPNTASTVPTALNDVNSCVVVDIQSTEVTVQTITEILATRLTTQTNLVSYLGASHKRAMEELKSMKQLKSTYPSELEQILEEIRSQTVSYAASSLMVPDLFEGGKDSAVQLAKCLIASCELSQSITQGVNGTTSSFYYCLCEELATQDMSILEHVVGEVVQYFTSSLRKMDTVLDGTPDGGPLTVTTAIAAMCCHKKVANIITGLSNFLLPPPDSPTAKEKVSPDASSIPPGASPQQRQFLLLMQAMNREDYLKRSGPALEKDTILGLVLRIGCPRDHPSTTGSFPNVLATKDSVEKTIDHMRRQLTAYQGTCNTLIRALVTAGADARQKVTQWITDALLVNVGATAMRPDHTKVSKTPLLMNLYSILLKLCEPFVESKAKEALIDPGFVSSEKDHGGVYIRTGDDAVSRLVENNASSCESYEPKNSFIPICFFLTARALHLSFVPLTALHHNLLRNISHSAWTLQQRNADLQSDPNFSALIGIQRANEVTLYESEMIASTLRYCSLMARFLLRLDEKTLGDMPEHFVDDICDVLNFLANPNVGKPKLLVGHEFGSIFRLVVKLLSPKFSNLVRNYNLRAKLGDALHDVYLPNEEKRNSQSVSNGVPNDPMAGGATFLLSDFSAQETLAPSLLLLYGEVEHTGFYEKMGHRANIASILKYLWDSKEHRPAFRSITANKESFIKFANGIMNETNSLIASIMEKLPEIRQAQIQIADKRQWESLTDEQREQISNRLEENESEMKRALPLCNKTLQMLGYLNTDPDIRKLFMLQEMCTRLVNMLLHVLTKLVGSKGLELKVRVIVVCHLLMRQECSDETFR